MPATAIIGLDGLSPADVDEFDVPGEWDPLHIETTSHTCPSWNAIFTGRDRDGVFDFFKLPDDAESLSGELADHSDEMWGYDDLRTDDYLWERFDVGVVSAPVVLPTFSTLGDDAPGTDLTWPTDRDEMARSIERLTELTLRHADGDGSVITVFPFPDKMHHTVDAEALDYSADDRATQMQSLVASIERITEAFDRFVLLSDHGRPTDPETIPPGDLWVASHEPTGVVRSNCIPTEGRTNRTINDDLADLLSTA